MQKNYRIFVKAGYPLGYRYIRMEVNGKAVSLVDESDSVLAAFYLPNRGSADENFLRDALSNYFSNVNPATLYEEVLKLGGQFDGRTFCLETEASGKPGGKYSGISGKNVKIKAL